MSVCGNNPRFPDRVCPESLGFILGEMGVQLDVSGQTAVFSGIFTSKRSQKVLPRAFWCVICSLSRVVLRKKTCTHGSTNPAVCCLNKVAALAPPQCCCALPKKHVQEPPNLLCMLFVHTTERSTKHNACCFYSTSPLFGLLILDARLPDG